MGARKKIAANKRKEAKRTVCTASLKGRPTSPRKMRLVVDTVRGLDVDKAINILTFTRRETADDVLKLLKSAINNWEQKFQTSPEESELFIKTITVDAGRTLKRFLPAPMGRAYRVRKRSCHVNIELASRINANTPIGEVNNNIDTE
ncbi:MAG: 50S ribosomal protein L22 [Chitinophagales bacterium]|nr:50S ribosomal protein L22 [Chitinophagales bacterium]MCZ2392527.1 50S ribosomal protein L22 [Chitinophagales bacterium]